MWKIIKPTSTNIINAILKELSCIQPPMNCDLTKLGPLHYASLYLDDIPENALIRENIYSGMDLDPEIALLKSLIERVERRAIEEGRARREACCIVPRSDGVAAFPRLGCELQAPNRARQNALGEAIERYSWASWWDNLAIGAKVFLNSGINWGDAAQEIVQEIKHIVPIKDTIRIEPLINSDFQVQIYFFSLENGGLISGGAAGLREDEPLTQIRAIGELARHASCAKRILGGALAETFYERRLLYMVMNQTSRSLKRRLSESGETPLILPTLRFDEPIKHSLDKVVAVHRCYFNGQPPFVGGDLERLCL